MPSILSEQEVESLLGGINEGKVKTETDIPQAGEGLGVFDFSKQQGPVHLRMPALEIIIERFVGFLTTSLSAATGLDVGVEVGVEVGLGV